MRNSIYSCILCFGLLATGCSEETIYKVGEKGALKGSIVGYVPGFGSSPLADAEVVLEGTEPLLTLRTDSNGRFETQDLPTGTYNLVIKKQGYGTYKILGFSFVGGAVATIVPPATVYKLPTLEITEAAVTVSPFYNGVHAAITMTSTSDEISTFGFFRYYLSSDDNVSSSLYQETGILGSFSQSGSHMFGRTFPSEKYPAGTNLYMIIYPCSDQYSTYIDLETGRDVFSSLGESKSSVLKITIPN